MNTPRLPRSDDGRTAVQVARQCVQEGGRLARRGFRSQMEVTSKGGRGNIVTEVDLAVERCIVGIIEAAYPDHRILSEETRTDTPTDGWAWVIDPIDGTQNFAMGIPFFAINLALCHDGVPQVGITYEPVRREEFFAVRGRGMRVNGLRSYASTKGRLDEAVLNFGLGYDDVRSNQILSLVRELWPRLQGLRDVGSAALGQAYAACGRFDIYVAGSVAPWDIAPGLLLLEEAGAACTDRLGRPANLYSPDMIAGGGAVHADFLRTCLEQPWYRVGDETGR